MGWLTPLAADLTPFERGEIGPTYSARLVARALSAKHHDRPYRGGRQNFWTKSNNRSRFIVRFQMRLGAMREPKLIPATKHHTSFAPETIEPKRNAAKSTTHNQVRLFHDEPTI
ncbi:hypothetical protein WI560_26180 [Bradyrhizobium sp. A11]|jgi:hypothetical protein|uniref:hypothetical protein n=1 Tax=Bradyrhizobium sp. A11 TaxID=3133974 RepID=UPI00325393EA